MQAVLVFSMAEYIVVEFIHIRVKQVDRLQLNTMSWQQ